ncbi:DUF6456 domain-containing protein [Pseudochrobactrum saccharolyticum]|uniref:DUF6456 domain-containing protein n=1 Tax=Pseudochrobactrum saccharolyticum TaxID=354352 RepID=UPI00276176A1|nr:DUF6456 domain-containing protein [Pseudochrobactrum saccharolyticum]MDP8251432.1 hypothetical protein [Pseudochrobactrum saccharolyticum]
MSKTVTAFSPKDQQSALRVLRFLLRSAARFEGEEGRWFLTSDEGGTITCDELVLQHLLEAGLVKAEQDKITLELAGRDLLMKLKKPAETEQPQEPVMQITGENIRNRAVNNAESPLTLLYRKNKQTGRRFLSDDEFHAGERLRADFTRGNMMPRISANWDASVAGRIRGERGGAAELSDYALDCRDRVNKALIAVGPELSGILLDICCFLKGLELVERERSWPARSAKMMLKTALSILHRHYNAGRMPEGITSPAAYHWGAPDYRPSL